jgi:hypothetical protein
VAFIAKPNVLLLEMDDIISQDDVVDNFSHLKRQGYIKLSQSLLETAKHCFKGAKQTPNPAAEEAEELRA